MRELSGVFLQAQMDRAQADKCDMAAMLSEIVSGAPFVTRWCHHFHTFLSDDAQPALTGHLVIFDIIPRDRLTRGNHHATHPQPN